MHFKKRIVRTATLHVLVEQLKGNISVKRDHGTHFTIRFKAWNFQ
ncbi:MAG TPA: hypothetical protein VI112_00090 [Bacteroidia bacterium]|jgi:two-component sensor histidine kinase